MKKLFYGSMFLTIASLVIGMFSFDNFRDRVYLAAMLLGFISIFAGLEYLIRNANKK